MVSKSVKKFINILCKTEVEKNTLLEVIKCVPELEIPNWKKCVFSVNSQIDFLTRNESLETFHSDFCCLQHLVKECIGNLVIQPECEGRQLNPRTYFSNLLNVMVKDVYDIVCSTFKDRKKCYIHNAQRMDLLREVGNSRANVKGPMLFGPLLALLKKMTS